MKCRSPTQSCLQVETRVQDVSNHMWALDSWAFSMCEQWAQLQCLPSAFVYLERVARFQTEASWSDEGQLLYIWAHWSWWFGTCWEQQEGLMGPTYGYSCPLICLCRIIMGARVRAEKLGMLVLHYIVFLFALLLLAPELEMGTWAPARASQLIYMYIPHSHFAGSNTLAFSWLQCVLSETQGVDETGVTVHTSFKILWAHLCIFNQR